MYVCMYNHMHACDAPKPPSDGAGRGTFSVMDVGPGIARGTITDTTPGERIVSPGADFGECSSNGPGTAPEPEHRRVAETEPVASYERMAEAGLRWRALAWRAVRYGLCLASVAAAAAAADNPRTSGRSML